MRSESLFSNSAARGLLRSGSSSMPFSVDSFRLAVSCFISGICRIVRQPQNLERFPGYELAHMVRALASTMMMSKDLSLAWNWDRAVPRDGREYEGPLH